MADAPKALSMKDEAIPETTAEVRALLKRTHAGDETTLPVVRRMLDDPAALRMFGGDLAQR